MTLDGTRFMADLIQRKIEEGPKAMRETHAKLEELLESARRGIELRERFSPKTGRAFMRYPNRTR